MNDSWDVERVRAVRMEFGGGFDIKGGLLQQEERSARLRRVIGCHVIHQWGQLLWRQGDLLKCRTEQQLKDCFVVIFFVFENWQFLSSTS